MIFSNEEVVCEQLLLFKEYTLKSLHKTFTLNATRSCNNFNVICIVIFADFLEKNSAETRGGKAKLIDRVTVYR